MKRSLLILACALPMAVYAADNPDSRFYKDAAEAGLAEVNDATLATQSATDPKLKDFANRMIKDHSAANDKLAALAGRKNLTLPTSPSVGQMATHEKLKLESGQTFDKAYIKDQISAHRAAVRLLRKEISAGKDPDAQDFAKSILPTVEHHLSAIEKIATEDGVSTK